MIHHVFANRSNIGDWLSAKGVQQLLHPYPVAEHLCDEEFVASTLEQLGTLGSDDLVVIGGGGLFMDYFMPFWTGLLGLPNRPRYCLWGIGYCDLKAESSRPPWELLAEVVNRSALCVVRDDLTRRHLQIDRVPMPVPCPSLATIEPAPLGHGLLHVDNYTTVGATAFDHMHAVCQDVAAAGSRPYRRTNHRIESGREDELAHCLDLYRRSDLVVSSALHGCIVAVAMGRPVLAVSGDFKIDAFMAAAGLGDWVLDPSQLAELPSRLAALSSQKPAGAFCAQARAENSLVANRVVQLSTLPSPRRSEVS